ncbi:aminoglycoside phosphotransferase family protein [Bailinhaonella thermotolerans]|uniref:Aminoglycoside phosphotransferase family protein n=1 Tax=Bailinhaonella thermotolerans TaxID=1070861 RepID=A0A3A4B6I4_9ACTN|nr:aminoglycoside phosphotransferase family protein [Bailinhaonella thermotolerans]
MGFGGYHWSVTDRRGADWFVKVDDLDAGDAGREDEFARLRGSLATTLALSRDAGLDFVVAPVPGGDGDVLRRLSPRYTVAVFPMIAGAAGEFGPHRPEHLAEMADLLAGLHSATPAVAHLAARADLRLPGRDRLTAALADLGRPWTDGPHGEAARELLTAHADRVRTWLADFDRLAGEVRRDPAPWVVTHGEPHPGNVLRAPSRTWLLDWATVQIAPPERDLWMLTTTFTGMLGEPPATPGEDPLARYESRTGRTPSPAAIALYGRWWPLADLAVYADTLRRPHPDTEDTRATLTYLTLTLDS